MHTFLSFAPTGSSTFTSSTIFPLVKKKETHQADPSAANSVDGLFSGTAKLLLLA